MVKLKMPKRRRMGAVSAFSVWPLPEVANWVQKQIWNEKDHISLQNFCFRVFWTAKKNPYKLFSIVFSKSDLIGIGLFLSRKKILKKPNALEYALVLVVTWGNSIPSMPFYPPLLPMVVIPVVAIPMAVMPMVAKPMVTRPTMVGDPCSITISPHMASSFSLFTFHSWTDRFKWSSAISL